MNNGWLKKIMKNYDIILRKCFKENLLENKFWQKYKIRREEVMMFVECLECLERLWFCGVGKERI